MASSADEQQAAAKPADVLDHAGSHGEDEFFDADTPPRVIDPDDPKPRLQFDENAPSPSKTTEEVTLDSPLPSSSGRLDGPATLTLSSESAERQPESAEEPVRSKLETRKRLDLESPIPGPGKSRNIRAPNVTEMMDLKVAIIANEKRTLPKTDPFTAYKIRTDVSSSTGPPPPSL